MNADELYDDISQEAIVDVEEDLRIERRLDSVIQRSLGDYFSMWANTPPMGGIILIGVENDGTVSEEDVGWFGGQEHSGPRSQQDH